MQLEALIFDVDGTLAENEEWHRRAFNESFKASGLDWTWDKDLYRALLQVTGGKERIRHFIATYKPANSDEALQNLLPLHADKSRRYADYVAGSGIAARPGIKRLVLEAHKKGFPLAIATTTTLGNVEALIKVIFGSEGRQLFSVIAAGDVVPRKKPAPDIYVYACEHLGIAPASCVAIEDSENGVRAAYDAGLTVVATPSVYVNTDNFSRASSVLSDLGEPDAPYHHIAGAHLGKGYVDMASLQSLVAETASARP